MDVEIKGQKKKVAKKASSKKKIVREEQEETSQKLSKVEAKRTQAGAYEKTLIRKMSQEQKEIAIIFMEQRNEARVKAGMEPAYSQADMDLYK